MGSFTYYVNTLDKVRDAGVLMSGYKCWGTDAGAQILGYRYRGTDAGVKMLGYKCCGYKCIQSCNYSVIHRQKVVLVLTAGIGRGF